MGVECHVCGVTLCDLRPQGLYPRHTAECSRLRFGCRQHVISLAPRGRVPLLACPKWPACCTDPLWYAHF